MKQFKSLLIIGGTGFFGKSILDFYKRGGLNTYGINLVIVLARNIEKFKSNHPELVFSGVIFFSGDISVLDSIPETDYIIHAATSTNMNDYSLNVLEDVSSIKYRGISNFCDIVMRMQQKANILYCSSGAVYGKQPISIENISEDFEFEENLNGWSIEKQNYCSEKRFAEKSVIGLGRCGISVSIARCFAFYGKYLPKDQHFAYGNFIGQAERGEKVVLSTDCLVYRSYLSADDLVISLISILMVSTLNCPIYNVGSDIPVALHDLAIYIAKKYNVDYEYKISDPITVMDRYVPNIDKLKLLLNKSKLSSFVD